ncbi:TetR/AcrR family transcriptional regulator [Blastococcus sp. Marseille-P5729]|uniref:TetR/AcrR family transcriptional regulator n=1 Tax=Blastococcus sp. Marseille-P5729 TaxID=2086582 RepID=UPI000D114F0E|nr:TetR/AcrR family transcriptional regulator [Blastococcus sp. Marseille-P5729]
MPDAPAVVRSWQEYEHPDLDPVLTAAVDAFNEVGYHGATVRDIARRCGLSVAGIYHHHAGKQEMLVAILAATMNELLWRNQAARAAGGDDPVARFRNQIRTLTLSHIYWLKPAAIGSSEMRSLAPDNRRAIVAMRSGLQQHIQKDVDEAVARGLFRTPYPKEAVRSVVGMCIQTGQWYDEAGELRPEQIADRIVQIALDTMAYVPEREESTDA